MAQVLHPFSCNRFTRFFGSDDLKPVKREVVITMNYDRSSSEFGDLNEVYVPRVADDCVSGRGEEVRLRALKLFVVRATAERHGGTMEIDLATDTVSISVPKKEMEACTEEIAKQLGGTYVQPE